MSYWNFPHFNWIFILWFLSSLSSSHYPYFLQTIFFEPPLLNLHHLHLWNQVLIILNFATDTSYCISKFHWNPLSFHLPRTHHPHFIRYLLHCYAFLKNSNDLLELIDHKTRYYIQCIQISNFSYLKLYLLLF